MAGKGLLILSFLIYPLIVILFNRYIRHCIPCKCTRHRFLMKNVYVNKLLYLLIPLLVLHFELLLLTADYPFSEIDMWMIVVPGVFQVYLFSFGVIYFVRFFAALGRYKKRTLAN